MSDALRSEIAACRLCADRFAATHTGHEPRPVVWFSDGPKILVAGQAPGLRVHQSGKPFDDPSGNRLRDWLGVDKNLFYDRTNFGILPMAFCFPGYDSKGSDLPPPPLCARTWRDRVMASLAGAQLLVLVGGYAQKWHLKSKAPVTETVKNWRQHAPAVFPLPHPSWRNTGWIKRNPWFTADLLPELREQVSKAIG